jgi:Ca2+-binding RTX toxin-like protein
MTLVGGAGNDTFVVTNAGDVIKAHVGQVNTVLTTLNSYVLPANVQKLTFAGTGAFNATGNGLADVITGGAGPNTLKDGGGASTLIGGGGTDTFYVSNAATVVNEAAGGAATVYVSAPSWTATAGSAIQRVVATGTGSINLVGSSGHAMTLVANNGSPDSLSDGGSADTLIGGTGDDTFVVTNAGTVVQAVSGGYDTVKTTLNAYALPANVQNLVFTGTGAFHAVGNDQTGSITGGAGNDTFVSGTGVEILNGGGGTDTFYVNNAQDVVNAAANSHSVEFTSVSSLKAAANIVALTYTGTGNFSGYANNTGTFVTGGHGNDFLEGGAGSDTLDGGGGADTLMAGSGADQFRFDAPGNGVNRIIGFKVGVDHIALNQTGFGLNGLSSVEFDIGSSPNAVADGHAQILYNTSTGALYFDASGGDGHLVQLANLDGHPALTAASFTLV